ncbi:MAG TPA: tetratricopeptide repeat protein [Thermoanaerobaculia bacterium]|jgi:tetratricopeptide (TPR) repeat protein
MKPIDEEAFEHALRDPQTWEAVDLLRSRPSRFREALALKERIDAEDAAAARLLSPLLRSPLRFRNAAVARNPKAQTAGVVRFLCAAAHERHEKRPEFSLELTLCAYEIAATLAPSTPQRFFMALSLRERANALRYLGRFTEALEALDSAEELFDQSPAADPHDVAIVHYIRATVLLEIERPEEACLLSRRAANIFREYGDRPREHSALMSEATSLHFTGRNSEAAVVYGRVAAQARADGDRIVLAHALNNAASAHIELERFDDAESSLIEALVIFDELHLATEKARVAWLLALVLVRRGDLADGAIRLNAVREDLERLKLVNDHALATLDWAFTRLALGEPSGVAAACERIVVRFESERMMKSARIALAHLHEALAAGSATPTLVSEVRKYLEHLPAHPDVPFIFSANV